MEHQITHRCGHSGLVRGSTWEAQEAATRVCWDCYQRDLNPDYWKAPPRHQLPDRGICQFDVPKRRVA